MTRRRSTSDERVLLIDLTDEGRELRELALQVPGRVMEAVGLDVEEIETLRDALAPFAGRAGRL